ncbi:DivIVA domain-containing protein [Krasilnikovia sp. M28-CT-15]|uniref:DivIVA domain-containing protein n=1 Tax=Krasilnikovia sp. M28-CT-15 TaxID=3373540 RepID=UPI003876204E
MTSQGQRFRRRALRRGYKVDEVDSFLDRVEATLAGEAIGAPVGAQEVHDVVFRVRFGGYDEWQVDLHLDRVERQLAEFEERGGRGADPRMAQDSMRDRMSNTGTMAPVDRMGSGMGRSAPPTERLPAPTRDDRMQDDRMQDDRMRDDRGYDDRMAPPQMPQRQQMPSGPGPDQYGRYDEPGYGQQQQRYPGPAGYDTGAYDAYEPGRHGKADMTAEIRMPERERGGYGGPAPMSAPPMSSAPMSGPPVGGPPMGGGPGGPGGELYRVDQLRRTFQPRRFGSGYDPMQVDRLFESILQAMSGRGPMPVPENELDTLQFGLVPGGYFEAEVDAALREVKDILLRRR